MIVVQPQPDLLEVVDALGAPRRLAGRLDRGQEQGNQDGDDRNDDQEFDQRETAAVALDGDPGHTNLLRPHDDERRGRAFDRSPYSYREDMRLARRQEKFLKTEKKAGRPDRRREGQGNDAGWSRPRSSGEVGRPGIRSRPGLGRSGLDSRARSSGRDGPGASFGVKSHPSRSLASESDAWDLNRFVGSGLEAEVLDPLGGLVEFDDELAEVLGTADRRDLRREFLAVEVDRDEPHGLVLDVMSDR